MARTKDASLGAPAPSRHHKVAPSTILLGIVLSTASAVLTVLAHPPNSLAPLVFLSFVPAIVAQHHVFPRRAAGVASAISIAGPVLWGVVTTLPGRASVVLWVFPFVLAAALVVLGAVDRALMEATRYRYFVFAVPLFWSAVAFGTSKGPGGTIGQGANALHTYPVLIQPLSIVGTLGLVLAVFLANWACGAVALAAVGHPDFSRRRIRRIAVATVAVAIGWVALSLGLFVDPDATVRVAAVQPGSRTVQPRVGMDASALVEPFADATRRAADRGAQLVVWPETGLPFDPRIIESERIGELARETGAYIAVGYGVHDGKTARNEAVLVTPRGRFLGPYAKQHPVTLLGERSDSDYGYPTFDTRLGKIALLICYDLDYLDTPRNMARQGAGLIAVPSFDWSEIANVHYTSFVLRAIENRVSLVKADYAWDSVIIDPYGRVLVKNVDPDGSGALLVADVPVGSGRSPAATLGDLIGLVLVTAALGVLALVVRGARRAWSTAPVRSDES